MTPPLSQTLVNLKQINLELRAYYHGIRKAEAELSAAGVKVPEHFKRSMFHLGMYLDEVALDIDNLTK